MSFFVCGRFHLSESRSWFEDEAFAFQILEAAVVERLFVLLGLNVATSQAVVDILGIRDGELPPDQLLFSVTSSPSDPTADRLICPIENSKTDLVENMARLRRFFASVCRIDGLERVDLYFSEGYDDVYQDREVGMDEFDEVAVRRILLAFGADSLEGPSPKFTLKKESWRT